VTIVSYEYEMLKLRKLSRSEQTAVYDLLHLFLTLINFPDKSVYFGHSRTSFKFREFQLGLVFLAALMFTFKMYKIAVYTR